MRLPAPGELVEMDRDPIMQTVTGTLVPQAARAFQKLGQDDKAEELAKAGVAETKSGLALIECHRVLAELAHGRENAHEAETEFRAALEEAKSCGWKFLVLLCARDLKKMVLDKDGRGAEGDAIIDGACAAMGKGRGKFGGVL